MAAAARRLSPRNNQVAAALRDRALATLLIHLLTPAEEHDRANVFVDIALLASRLSSATDWALAQPANSAPADRLFRREHRRGRGTGRRGHVALAGRSRRVAGRAARPRGRCPRADDRSDPADRRQPSTQRSLRLTAWPTTGSYVKKELVIIEGAGHLFEEPGTLEEVQRHATRWFRCYRPGIRTLRLTQP